MTTGRINQVTIPNTGPPNQMEWETSPTANPRAPKKVQDSPSGRSSPDDMREFSKTRKALYRQNKPIKIIWTNPHSTPLPFFFSILTEIQCQKRREREAPSTGYPCYSPKDSQPWVPGSPSQLRTGITDLRERTASGLVEPHRLAHPSPSGSPIGLITRCNPRIRWASTSTTFF